MKYSLFYLGYMHGRYTSLVQLIYCRNIASNTLCNYNIYYCFHVCSRNPESLLLQGSTYSYSASIPGQKRHSASPSPPRLADPPLKHAKVQKAHLLPHHNPMLRPAQNAMPLQRRQLRDQRLTRFSLLHHHHHQYRH